MILSNSPKSNVGVPEVQDVPSIDDVALKEGRSSDQDAESEPPTSLSPPPINVTATSGMGNESSSSALKQFGCRQHQNDRSFHPSEHNAEKGGPEPTYFAQQTRHQQSTCSNSPDFPKDLGPGNLDPAIARHEIQTSHQLPSNIDTQDSPTQVNTNIENILMKECTKDASLPDTQPDYQNNNPIPARSFDSPTQINSNNLFNPKKPTTQDDSLLDTLVDPHVNRMYAPELAGFDTQEATITNHFSTTKSTALSSKNLATKDVTFHGSSGQPDDTQLSREAEVTLPYTPHSGISSLATQTSHGVLTTPDEALPDTQAALPSAVVSDNQIRLPSSGGRDFSGLETDSSLVLKDGAALPPTIRLEDEDLPDTQSESPDTGKILASGNDLVMRYEDSQATQGDTSQISGNSIGGLPSLKEMQARLNAGQQQQQFLDEAKKIPAASFTSDVSVSASSVVGEKAPLNKLTCRERKRIATSPNRPPSLTKAMKQWITKTHNLLDPFREDDDCWFHPSPPPARLTKSGILQPCGKLQKRFTWQDHRGKHSIVLNYGIVSKIINFKLTKQQKDGFINKQWHLSHLCGNWTCLNPTHTTVEPGKTNISRNNCFSHRSGCLHEPKCLKEKKVPLTPDGKPVNHTPDFRVEATQKAVDNWDNWSMQSFDDGEVSVLIDDQDEEEFALEGEDEDEDLSPETVAEIKAQS